MEEKPKTRADLIESEARRLRGLSDEAFFRERARFQGGLIGDLIEQEFKRRAAEPKHHWSLTPAFLVAILTMIFAAIAAWPVVRDWIFAKKAGLSEPAPVMHIAGPPTPLPKPSIAASPLPAQDTSSPVATPISEQLP